MEVNLLEKLKGERTPDESLAAQPKAFLGCSNTLASVAISNPCYYFNDLYKT